MKKLMLGILLCTQAVFAGEINFEVKAPFVELEERMQMELTDEFVDSLRPFARNLGRRLNSLLDRAAELNKADAEDYLVRALTQMVYESDIKIDEMLSREVLERAILIHRVLEAETDSNDFGVIDMRIRLLTRAIEMARDKYSNQDMNFFDTKSEISYAAFGKEYIVYLAGLNKSVFDASAQYQLQKLALKFYQYDLARDVNYESHATDIVEIHDSLPAFPDEVSGDRASIQYIRSLRKLMFTLDVNFPKAEVIEEMVRYGDIEIIGYVENKKFRFTGNNVTDVYNKCVHAVRGGELVTQADDMTFSVNKNTIYSYTTSGWWYNEGICDQMKAKLQSESSKNTRNLTNYLSGYVENDAIEIRERNRWEAFESCKDQVPAQFDNVTISKNGSELRASSTSGWWYRDSWCADQVNDL